MERIQSFCVDHTKLNKGVYISRVDQDVVTYDIRMTAPNVDLPMDPAAAHTIEHIGATLLRNGAYKDHIIYFGPMGCMTGFYLIVKDLSFDQVKSIVRGIFKQICDWTQAIPGAAPEECGNYSFMNLEGAKEVSKDFVSASWDFEYHYL